MKFRIHNEGWSYLIVSLILTIILFPFFFYLSLLFFFVTIYIFYFFRDPERSIPLEDVIVAPADGIVTFIGEVEAPSILNTDQKYKKVSIFLNIFNVHVNRIPCKGIIRKIKYYHGKFINASFDKSSTDNERNFIILQTNEGNEIVVVQIAGFIARRIFCEIKKDQELKQGEKIGMIRFGSRVDLYFNNYKILVKEKQSTIAGETLIAKKD